MVAVGAAAFRPEYPIYVVSGFFGGLCMLRFADGAALTAEIAREVEAGRDERPHWPPGLTVAQALHALRRRR